MASDVERVEEEEEDESANQVPIPPLHHLHRRSRRWSHSIFYNHTSIFSPKRNDMEVSQPIMACISDLAFKYAQQLAKDLELFAQHAGRKSVNMEDVILSAHRNEHLSTSLRSFCNDLKAKEPQSERKRKKNTKKEDKTPADVLHIADP